ncbi:YggN family protein [Shewanella dokdonensis]|uniref:YggN family protein n=1 Tax=Shewanella dokdonensis TaxID=712036 RepID=A0ABX8DGS9_9GAMM|nr:YggN family protein [Shewanella dokdonensis]MCL1074149.1 YggN family protein [Shewanella dokdonensis]QVK23880.1 YggN family protein [Shewanella dokdonensis]
MKTLMLGMTLGCVLLTPVSSVWAVEFGGHNDACDVSLNYDVTLTPKKLVIGEQGKERYRVEIDRLYVDGKEVSLNAEQKTLLTQYQQGMTKQIPEVVGLVDEAMAMANDAISTALTPLLGDDAGAKLDDMMTQLHERVGKMVYHKGDTYFIGATDDTLDKAFDEEFSHQIEDLVMQSMGSIMINIGKSMMNGEGDFSERMDAFGKRMDKLGDEIDQQMDERSKALDKRADRLCDDFQQVMTVEGQLRQSVPALSAYPLVSGRP